jgi:hypothetical protein
MGSKIKLEIFKTYFLKLKILYAEQITNETFEAQIEDPNNFMQIPDFFIINDL